MTDSSPTELPDPAADALGGVRGDGEAPAMGWRVKPLHTAADAPALPVTEVGLTIGRADTNQVVLSSSEFPGVSGTHARVVLRDGKVVLEDLGSKNGTLVAGEAVQRVVLEHGDVFELGRGGARFVVISPGQSDQTMLITESKIKPRRSMGADTVAMMREKLGIPEHTDVREVQSRSRRNTWMLLAVILCLVGGGVYVYAEQERDKTLIRDLSDRMDKEVRDSRTKFDAFRTTWEQRVGKLDAAKQNWEEQRRDLLEEKTRLEKVLFNRPSAADLSRLREQLAETERRIERYNPINLENERLAVVDRVEHAVVLIEVRQTFVEPKTNRVLHVEDGPDDEPIPNLEGRGRVYAQNSTGSGFCFHKDGWILTNAHVVLKKDARDSIRLGPTTILESSVELKVVFSNTKERHQARTVLWRSDGKKDLALIKIEPFPNMPFVPGIDTREARLPVAKSVFLLGFPLGKRALHQGETMIASAFRGIVSRTVDSYLQTDAAVHPGNSGGPVIDDTGKVIGVVVGMQRIDETTSTSAIGYVIPIAHAAEIWPPPGLAAGGR